MNEAPRLSWSEPLDPDTFPVRGCIDFTEPIVAILPHDDGARVVLVSGREFIVTPTR